MSTTKEIINSKENIFESNSFKTSRKAYTAQCTFEYFITILVGDAFLAKLLMTIGIQDSLIGIISSFVSLAFLFQLFSVFTVAKIRNVKKTVIVFTTLSDLLFMGLYLIPFSAGNLKFKTALVIICILLAYFGMYFVQTMLYKWANSYVSPYKRGEYSAVKEIISLVSGMFFTLIVGRIIDKYEFAGNVNGGFLFTAIAIFILSISNFVSLSVISKNIAGEKENGDSVSLSEIINNTLGKRQFVNVIIMTSLWDVSRYLIIGFMGTFKTKELSFSIFAVQIINIFGNILRAIVSKPFGRFSDRYSYVKGMKLAFVIAAFAFAFNMFSSENFRWCVVVYTVLYNVCTAGTNQNNFNITYSYVDKKYFSQALAIKNSIGGVLGFCASVAGGRIVSAIQANGNMVLGIHLYAQQVLSAVSFILILFDIVFVSKMVEKQNLICS